MSTTKNNILYQNSEVCFTCCSATKQHLPKSGINLFIHPQYTLEDKDKKISLKKYHTESINRQKSYKMLIKPPSLIRENAQTHEIYQRQSTEQRGFSPINANSCTQQISYSHRQYITQQSNHQQFNKKVQEKLANNFVIIPQDKLLSKTTKIQRILPTQSQSLKKTKKTASIKQLMNLSKLKESVCSYTQSCGQDQKFQQSIILQDYFNPTKAQLSNIESYLQEKQLKRTESSVIQPQTIR